MTTTTGPNEERQFIGPNKEQEINKLHVNLVCHAHDAISAAREIGKLLSKRKKEVHPDEWSLWLMNNTNLDPTTAENYIAAFKSNYPFELVTIDDVSFTCREAIVSADEIAW